jgi:DNA-binding MarR family transcriptional regulator
MKPERISIHNKLQSILHLTRQLEQAPRKFGTDELLTHTEIHLIETIGDQPDLSVTDIAALLEITKGAVSQNLKRLENKELTTKRTDPQNRSRLLVGLTAKGQTAYWAHKHWHETMDGGFARYMDELDTKETDTIIRFLSRIEVFINRMLEPET